MGWLAALLLIGGAAAQEGPDAEPEARTVPGPAWVQVGVHLDLRASTQIAESVLLRGGITRPSGLQLGGGVTYSSPREMREVGDARTFRSWSLDVGAWWWSRGAWAPGLGVTGGLAMRRFHGPWGPVDAVYIPTLGVEAGFAVPLGKLLSVVPGVRAQADLRRIEVRVADEPVALLSPFELTAGLSLVYPPLSERP
ncbi:MAG: hypothetical protein H6739_26425 [Alphaproteobacteria bacterium]|nr:hypothetical protein [Alphaproteobacteria bacterium]